MKNFIIASAYMALGAVSFWSADLIFNIRIQSVSAPTEIRVLTFLIPLVTGLCYVITRYVGRSRTGGPSVAGFMALGIWISGPLAITIGATYNGGGFSMPGAWPFVIAATLFFPVFTFMMATYDGTLGALFIASLFFTAMHLFFEKSYWILPPFVWNRIKRTFGLT